VVELLRARVPVTTLYVAVRIDADERVREAIRRVADAGLPVLEVPRPELDRLTGGAVHQGLAVQVPPYDYAHPSDLLDHAAAVNGAPPLIVALDGVTDPRNLGAVVRSAAAFGATGVLVPERRAAGMTAGAWKASAGAAARVPIARATNLTRTLVDYQRAGLTVVGLDADGEVGIDELELAEGPLALVVGSEGAGLSRLVSETCDLRARVPMVGGVESLNASVAAGIALYEIARRRSRRL
jgi:23S rRNA (guanosine2251-2'-O)-methyltransferase